MTHILEKDQIEMRQVYADTIRKLAASDSNVIALEADLSSSMSTGSLKNELPGQYVNVGIMEANMMGVAAGLSILGRKPFIHSFGQFVTRRAFDQVFVSLGYAQLSAVIVGSDAGVSAEHNGGTHMTFEDIALMREIPNVHVYEASDATQFGWLLENSYQKGGLHYIRTIRKNATRLYDEGTTFDNAKVLTTGSDITICATGIMVTEALKAAQILKTEGIFAEVIDMFSIKPLDGATLLQSVQKTGCVITAENHNINGGLGSAVAEFLGENHPVPLQRIGVREQFGQVGLMPFLQEFYGLTAANIVTTAQNLKA
ncbi:transketolase C-terminal [Listeria weihenstephanensis FSL R9-0317]|uniref:Transketolase n=1 Tax=Listeria weihenstephanensis TaxID=1006155 RepID=A0A1S7FWE5_9LIST|nr:transketolase C-terminal domain-containing protein [Listeria weihenstephanensis]AQY51733.1 transketolase [Listeria weihenstephanensis]EUJ41253.1 transketolase C-terminal [Listeria weihenstephanensis FSL R9-0317]